MESGIRQKQQFDLEQASTTCPTPTSEPEGISEEVVGHDVEASACVVWGNPPYPLPAREEECAVLDSHLNACLAGNGKGGGGLYVSGGPGTGKTCSIRMAAQAWRCRDPEIVIMEVNCMELPQRSVTGLLQHIARKALRQQGEDVAAHHEGVRGASTASPALRSCQGLAAQAVVRLAQLSSRVILIVDEVDQLFRHQGLRTAAGGSGSLDLLFSLHRLMGAPALAMIAIANAVDLLDRGTMPVTYGLCRTLLFKPYSVDQLRSIAKARLAAAGESGAAAEQSMGRVALELRVRQVAKRSGDCRPVVYMCEQALFQASLDREEAPTQAETAPTTPGPSTVQASEMTPEQRALKRRRSDPSTNDPLSAIEQLPLEQQVLLCALASAEGETVQFLDLCSRFKEMCKKLRQDTSLASKQAVNSALSALEQRGLLGLHGTGKRSAGRNRSAICPPNGSKTVVELAVSCAAVRQAVAKANAMLETCLIGGA
eukprot:CAMPEP_0172719668 /NCGR_PEP_ID=MMETSP1074-20121228/75637_1 /TAXON_ID=2916 /ORGANISM="Ceratium fusus, Strain PA161109" /LENGTH=484 /DNA_ID=CAMNT_0013545051 /DNA_START=152 /DNA_END=1606 /DNA_ORIENTATION=+